MEDTVVYGGRTFTRVEGPNKFLNPETRKIEVDISLAYYHYFENIARHNNETVEDVVKRGFEALIILSEEGDKDDILGFGDED